MNGQEFIDVATRLAVATTATAGTYRSAVSRAYYGAYHLAREFLNSLGFHASRGSNEHQWVQRHFCNCQLLVASQLGRLLENLHVSRKEADYDLQATGNDSAPAARLAVLRAEQIKSLLIACQNELATVRGEMVAYRKTVRLE
jgi:uncharacterized protein (UPF0332 family)